MVNWLNRTMIDVANYNNMSKLTLVFKSTLKCTHMWAMDMKIGKRYAGTSIIWVYLLRTLIKIGVIIYYTIIQISNVKKK